MRKRFLSACMALDFRRTESTLSAGTVIERLTLSFGNLWHFPIPLNRMLISFGVAIDYPKSGN